MFASDAAANGYEEQRIAPESMSDRPVAKMVDDRIRSIDELYERDARLLAGAAMLER